MNSSEKTTANDSTSKSDQKQDDSIFSAAKDSKYVQECYARCEKIAEFVAAEKAKAQAENKPEPDFKAYFKAVTKEYLVYIAKNPFSKVETKEVLEAFINVSDMGMGDLKSDLAQTRKQLKKESLIAEGLASDDPKMVACTKVCQELEDLDKEEQTEARQGLYRVACIENFSKEKVELIKELIVAHSAVGKAKVNKEYKVARVSFYREVTEERRKQQAQQTGIDIYPYVVIDGAFHIIKETTDGSIEIPICNFSARIVDEINYDDGSLGAGVYRIKGGMKQGKNDKEPSPLPTIEVLKEDYRAMNWVEKWRNGPVIYAGKSEDVRVATKVYSGKTPHTVVYTHMGWRKIDDNWYYLHHGGFIGTTKPKMTIETDLGNVAGEDNISIFQDYNLFVDRNGKPLSNYDKKKAARASLNLLQLVPEEVSYPLLAAIFRAPLSEALTVDLGMFVVGKTGTFKSQLTALAQAHFGAKWHGKHFPAGWDGTTNSLTKMSFLAKDAIFTIDDYNPTGSSGQVKAYEAKAEAVFRAQANQSGRARMKASTGLRPSYYPRGLVLSSGEDMPKGHSLIARVIFLELRLGDICRRKLKAAQDLAKEGVYTQNMIGFLEWAAPQIGAWKTELPNILDELREQVYKTSKNTVHNRLLEQLANLYLGMMKQLEYYLAIGAINLDEKKQHLEKCWEVLKSLAFKQSGLQSVQDPVNQFIAVLSSLLATGKAHFEDLDGEAPKDCQKYGWREIQTSQGINYHPQGDCIGWVKDSGEIYLDGQNAYRVVSKFAEDQKEDITMKRETLYKRMGERGLLLNCEKDRNTTRETIKGKQKKVYQIPKKLIFDDELTGQTGLNEEEAHEEQEKNKPSSKKKVSSAEDEVGLKDKNAHKAHLKNEVDLEVDLEETRDPQSYNCQSSKSSESSSQNTPSSEKNNNFSSSHFENQEKFEEVEEDEEGIL